MLLLFLAPPCLAQEKDPATATDPSTPPITIEQRVAESIGAEKVFGDPNIAKVFDGGVTESRQPYFVMELVEGMDWRYQQWKTTHQPPKEIPKIKAGKNIPTGYDWVFSDGNLDMGYSTQKK